MENETSMAMTQIMKQDLVSLDRFYGLSFTRYKDKLIFFLTTLKTYILEMDLAPLSKPAPNEPKSKGKKQKGEEDELRYRGYILNSLSNHLYNLYTNSPLTNEIWESLKNKYKTEEEGTKKFLMFKYFDFKIFDKHAFVRTSLLVANHCQ